MNPIDISWSNHARKRYEVRFSPDGLPDPPLAVIHAILVRKNEGELFRVRQGAVVYILAKVAEYTALIVTVYRWRGPQKSNRKSGKRSPKRKLR